MVSFLHLFTTHYVSHTYITHHSFRWLRSMPIVGWATFSRTCYGHIVTCFLAMCWRMGRRAGVILAASASPLARYFQCGSGRFTTASGRAHAHFINVDPSNFIEKKDEPECRTREKCKTHPNPRAGSRDQHLELIAAAQQPVPDH